MDNNILIPRISGLGEKQMMVSPGKHVGRYPNAVYISFVVLNCNLVWSQFVYCRTFATIIWALFFSEADKVLVSLLFSFFVSVDTVSSRVPVFFGGEWKWMFETSYW